MRKLVESTFVTLDGVIGSPEKWGPPYWDDEHMAYARKLLKFGTGELDRTLLAAGLLDELHLWIFPVLAGSGQPLIAGDEPTHLRLLESTRFDSGIIVNVYAPK